MRYCLNDDTREMQKFVCFLICIYFLCFTVAPVSSVIPSAGADAREIAGFENRSHPLLLYDLVCGNYLKKQ